MEKVSESRMREVYQDVVRINPYLGWSYEWFETAMAYVADIHVEINGRVKKTNMQTWLTKEQDALLRQVVEDYFPRKEDNETGLDNETRPDEDMDRPRVFFISGHRDITQDEFREYYESAISKAIEEYPDCRFVVGDYQGVDIMAQQFLKVSGIDPGRVTVYHMFNAPRHIATSKFRLSGGYASDEERDAAMTLASDEDIAWIRKGKSGSGTAINILRRRTMR